MGMNQLEENLAKYFKAVEEVRQENDLDKEEKLKRLLDPIVNLQNGQSSPNRRHKFAREGFINLNEEIDLSSLEKTSEEWEILSNWKLARFGDIDTDDEIISVNYFKFLPEIQTTGSIGGSIVRTSVHKLYKHWLPYLNQQRMQSRSLLDQILVCYTIKRAQNGDEKAVDKLIGLYTERAESKETYDNVLKMMVWREKNKAESNDTHINTLKGITWRKKNNNSENADKPDSDSMDSRAYILNKTYDYDVDDFRQLAKIYLVFIIRGFSPKSILDSFINGQKSGFLPIPRGVTNVFLHYFGEYVPGIAYEYVDYLSSVHEYLKEPGNAQKLIKMIESMTNVIECFGLQEETDLKVNNLDLLKNNVELLPAEKVMEIAVLISPIVIKLHDAVAPYFATLLDPYTPISSDISLIKNQRAARILSACYRPHKMSPRKNLTTWLFGGGDGQSYALGKLYQILCDYYSLKTNNVNSVPFNASPKSEYQKKDDAIREHIGCEIDEAKERVDQTASLTHDLQAIIKKANVSKEDYELLLDNSEGFTLDELAEKYNLTKDQVRYKLKTILEILQKTAN
jgi:hypothetical protein